MNKYESSKKTPETSCIYVLYNEQHYTIKTEPLAEHHTRSCWWTPANQKEIALTLHGARLRCTTGSWMFHNVAQLRTGEDVACGSGFNMFTSQHHTVLRAKQLRRELRLRFFKPPFLEHWGPRRSKQIATNRPWSPNFGSKLEHALHDVKQCNFLCKAGCRIVTRWRRSRRLAIPDNFDWWTWPSYKSTASSWIWMDLVVKRGYRDTPVRYTPVRYRRWNPTMDWFYKGVSFSRGIIVLSFHAVSLLGCKPTPESFFYLEPICPLFGFSLKTKSLEKEQFDFPTSYIHVCTYISHVSGAVPQAPRMSRSWRSQRCCHSWGSKRSSCSILDEGWLSMRRFGWLTSTSESPLGNVGPTEI